MDIDVVSWYDCWQKRGELTRLLLKLQFKVAAWSIAIQRF